MFGLKRKKDVKSSKNFYITSPIFYPNANLHLGHAYTMTVCDILARYHKVIGEEVYFLTGADENTGKVVKAAFEQNKDVGVFLDEISKGFENLFSRLNISYSQFIRTSDKERHWPGAIALWKKLTEAGDIYPGTYSGLYCSGCESFYTEKDLIDGKCSIHLSVPEKIEEKNYFFKLSKYTSVIKEKIEKGELNIIPDSRRNEVLALLGRGLDDVSFSRPIKNVPHGIPVPGDSEQVIYVWCDALVNYISALGFGEGEDALFEKFWPADLHVLGKDILRFHAAIWPAMLLSAKISLPKNLLIHGFITSGGHKMSKSIGNVINPIDLIDEYGADAVRYYFTREISPFDDGDMTKEKFKEAYNANLSNGLGNLASRIMKMAETYLPTPTPIPTSSFPEEFTKHLDNFDIQKAADFIWSEISRLDESIQKTEPFKLVKVDEKRGQEEIKNLVIGLSRIAHMVGLILPETADKILKAIKENKMFSSSLFPRKD
ncbi:MAG: methionine--tRNA ligase [Parcubacteria group bacterium]|nr:methionine--tRNA ligase [Parcubacteria group bacterium]